ncbi:hypothetical protein [Pseudomonas aeruginosa]|uniref:hypothetical protein n=1 Tax=Pseudomonas aeruginosa TaxID=287 RepID=UPI00106CFDAC|nr:hypothetical protein [Pseudomonas aeruginosa]
MAEVALFVEQWLALPDIGQDFKRCGNGLTSCSGLQSKTLGSQSAWLCPEAREGAAWMNFESGSSLMNRRYAASVTGRGR